MPKAKDGGSLSGDRLMFTRDEAKKINGLLDAGKNREAKAIFNKIIYACMEYENSVVDMPTKERTK